MTRLFLPLLLALATFQAQADSPPQCCYEDDGTFLRQLQISRGEYCRTGYQSPCLSMPTQADQTAAPQREAGSSLPATVGVAADQSPRRCATTDPQVPLHDNVGEDLSGHQCIEIEAKDSEVLVTLRFHEQDHDLCVWEHDEDWDERDRYADCHGHRRAHPEDLHCRSSRGGADVEQVRIDDGGDGLMACVVPWQGASGTYRFSAE